MYLIKKCFSVQTMNCSCNVHVLYEANGSIVTFARPQLLNLDKQLKEHSFEDIAICSLQRKLQVKVSKLTSRASILMMLFYVFGQTEINLHAVTSRIEKFIRNSSLSIYSRYHLGFSPSQLQLCRFLKTTKGPRVLGEGGGGLRFCDSQKNL